MYSSESIDQLMMLLFMLQYNIYIASLVHSVICIENVCRMYRECIENV